MNYGWIWIMGDFKLWVNKNYEWDFKLWVNFWWIHHEHDGGAGGGGQAWFLIGYIVSFQFNDTLYSLPTPIIVEQ